jgi:arginase
MLGYREDEAYLDSLREAGIPDWSALTVIDNPAAAATGVLEHLERDDLDGFWVHLDVDILDAKVMPAVDSPDPGGLQHEHLRDLLKPILASPRCVGFDIGIFDPDLDPDGRYAILLTDILATGLRHRSTRPHGLSSDRSYDLVRDSEMPGVTG